MVAPYRTKTGLSIEDVRDAFRDGDWLLRARRYFFGGPKWARIADVTLEPGQAISVGRWDLVPQLIAGVNVLRHNNGRIVDKFGELARDGQ